MEIKDTIERICTFGTIRSAGAATEYLFPLQDIYRVYYITKFRIPKLDKSKFVEWSRDNFIGKLMKNDLCILVHEDTVEKAFKANTRLITAMSIGMPAIVSDTPTHITAMKACGAEDLIISSPSDVMGAIKRLESKDRRWELQARFRDYAWSNYDPHDMSKKLADVFDKVRRK
jgi:hypothetical protein